MTRLAFDEQKEKYMYIVLQNLVSETLESTMTK